MPNVQPSKDLEIVTSEPGVTYMPGSSLRVIISNDQPNRSLSEEGFLLDVRLFDASQEELSSIQFAGDDLDELPDIGLPSDTLPGYYEMRYRLYQNDRLVISHVQPFFVGYADFSLNGISVYPSILEPDSQGIMRVDIQFDTAVEDQEGNRPEDLYLVWRLDSSTVHQGLLSEGADEIRIRSPEREGNYSVQVDVYPAAPEEGGQFSFRSVNRLDPAPRVTVLKDPKPRSYELQPTSSYYSLLRLNGNLRDIGQRMQSGNEQFRPESGVEPQLVIYNDRLGHDFDGSDQLYTDDYVLPPGYVDPFTVTFRGRFDIPDGPEAEETWLRASHGSWSAALTGDYELLRAEIGWHNPIEFTAPRQIIPDDTQVQWSFSYLVEGSVAFGMWTVNGMLLHVDSVDLPSGFISDSVQSETGVLQRPVSRIGGGVIGILEEFGVFYREDELPSIDTGSFRRAMELLFPHTLIFADSFTGSTERLEDYDFSEGVTSGGGFLHIPAGASVRLPSVFFRNADIILELLFAENPEDESSYLLLQAADAMNTVHAYEIPLKQKMQLHVSREGRVFTLEQTADSQDIETAGVAMDAAAVAGMEYVPDSLSVSAEVVNNSGTDAVLRMQHVLARHSSSSGIDDFF
ncbi:hypothetical protein JCM12856_09000 [Spirochaeta dissipatitropha]